MSRRATLRPRKSSCLYLSWAFPGWNKGGGGRKGSDSSFDLFYPSPPSRLFLSYTPPVAMDVAEMGAQPRRPRRLQTFLSELFTELQFLVFATFLYITDPSLASSLRQLFLYSSFSVSFFFFFYRYITDRFSFVLASINQEKWCVITRYDVFEEKTSPATQRFWSDKDINIRDSLVKSNAYYPTSD